MENITICDCGHVPSKHSEHTTGYGTDETGRTKCWECCAEDDKAYMRAHGKIILYYVEKAGRNYVTNWPGTLEIKIDGYRTSRHNMGGTRTDFWFMFEGATWHGYQIGDDNQIAHCRRTKATR